MNCCENFESVKTEDIESKGAGLYTCPMHPEVIREKPGMCPECGMQLVSAGKKVKEMHHKHEKEHEAGKHKGHSMNVFKNKFWVSLALSIPIILYSDMAQKLIHFSAPAFPGSEYLPFVLATIVFFYGGLIFLTSAYRELKAKMPGMMTLIALGITVAYSYSVVMTFSGKSGELYSELATLIAIMLLGHWIEMRAVTGAKGALKELSKLLPDTVEVEREGKMKKISLSELKKGDIVLVKPGGRIPADGEVLRGISEVDESIATGESRPLSKKVGDSVIAGTVNGDGSLYIKVSKIGEETFLSGVMRLVAEAESSKSHLQTLSDKAAFYLTVVAVLAGGATLATWLAYSDMAFAINRMVAVLVITCPHALGLAIPLVASISTTKAARNGFLVKRRLALEAARNIDVVLFDKTGTLTEAEFKVTKVSGDEALSLAASINLHSEHPIGRAMVKEAKNRSLTLSEVADFKRVPGRGAEGIIAGKKVFVGTRGGNEIVVEEEGKILGTISMNDAVRAESREAVLGLKEMGVKVMMITGDSGEVAKQVAGELGIDEYFARVLPEDKVKKVKELEMHGFKVAMVGDGVNDAPALAQADLGIAIGAGTNVAIESAGIILVRNDPRDIAKIIHLSRLTYRKMLENLFWATGYNVIAIPLAAGVLAGKGIILSPALGAVFMSLSTVIVAVNALFLRKKKL